jgi:hypothetical protein
MVRDMIWPTVANFEYQGHNSKSSQDVCWKFSTVYTNEHVSAENVNYMQQNDSNWRSGIITHVKSNIIF